jgi:hypothetical protein
VAALSFFLLGWLLLSNNLVQPLANIVATLWDKAYALSRGGVRAYGKTLFHIVFHLLFNLHSLLLSMQDNNTMPTLGTQP